MRKVFQLKSLSIAVAALSVASVASAAGLDRSGQDITAFLQDGLYAEASYTYLDADVGGKDISGNKIDDMAESYDFFRYGVKADLNDTFSVGILYDEPFGAAADYSGTNDFVANSSADALVQGILKDSNVTKDFVDNSVNTIEAAIKSGALTGAALEQAKANLVGLKAAQNVANTAGQGTNVEVRTESITGILGAKFGANKEFQIYGGPVAQRVKADVKLRGTAYDTATGYSAHISPNQDYGWLAGMSYSKPEIALKAALTYRSEIDHEMNIFESFPLATAAGATALEVIPDSRGDKIKITTPKSVNLDFQTGVNPTTLATAKVRWVPWGDFAIVPPLYNEVSKIATGDDKGLPLVSYDKDQWMVELGLAKRLTDALAVTGNIGWDSGAGDPVTSLGPIDGYYSAGLGAKYNLTENWAISAGGKYLWFGDAKGKLPTDKIVGEFTDNDGYALGVKVSYQAK